MNDESRATEQLEKISRAIRDLEGLPVEYALAKKLADVTRHIASLCAPVTVLVEQPRNSCNRHVDCAMAVKVWKEKHPGETPGFNFHCHDDECEDCFGC